MKDKTSSVGQPLVTDEDVPNRGHWPKCDFILSCLGYAVGLGNVWRFPHLAYDNGGGAFLVPYLVMLILVGIPVFFFEVSLGQYCSQGPITVWRACPMFKGLGIGMLVVAWFVSIYYNVIIAYSIYYLYASFTKNLPWERCDHDFNTAYCASKFTECMEVDGKVLNYITCINVTSLCDDELSKFNIVYDDVDGAKVRNTSYKVVDPYSHIRNRSTQEYWTYGVLQESESLDDTGGLIWELAVCLLLAWILVFLCLIKGIKSFGKVVYFTALFPYAVLTALVIRGVTLDGAIDGINELITPKWDDITNVQVWLDATVQIFFSLGLAFGGLITLSSYNKFHNNVYADAVFVPIANCATSILAAFAIFSVLGHVALDAGKNVTDVVDSGFGLAFVAYPEGLSLMYGSTAWAIAFFLMLITLGLDSQFVLIESIVTALVDSYPGPLRKKKTFVTLVFCVVGCLIGLICVTRSGGYWVALLDAYAPSVALPLFGMLELVAIMWIYGVKRFTNDIRSMLGDTFLLRFPMFFWWQLTWTVITPSLLLFLMLNDWLTWRQPMYGDKEFLEWGHYIGWIIVATAVIFIPVMMMFEFLVADGSLAARWKAIKKPRPEWGPANYEDRLQAHGVHETYSSSMGGKLYLGEMTTF